MDLDLVLDLVWVVIPPRAAAWPPPWLTATVEYPGDVADAWIPLVARVEWRSEHRAGQRPLAVWLGGERRPVQEERHWVEGPSLAGGPLATVWLLRDAGGRRYRVQDRQQAGALVEVER